MNIEKLLADLRIISKLDDEPNDVGGLTAQQLKAKFDEGVGRVQDYINDVLLPALASNVPENSVQSDSFRYLRINSEGMVETSEDGMEWRPFGGGHIILNDAGSEMPARQKLQFRFANVVLEDDMLVVEAIPGESGEDVASVVVGTEFPEIDEHIKLFINPEGTYTEDVEIEGFTVNEAGNLIITMKDGRVIDAGHIKGEPGDGDMETSVYDPEKKGAQNGDIYSYADAAEQAAAESGAQSASVALQSAVNYTDESIRGLSAVAKSGAYSDIKDAPVIKVQVVKSEDDAMPAVVAGAILVRVVEG